MWHWHLVWMLFPQQFLDFVFSLVQVALSQQLEDLGHLLALLRSSQLLEMLHMVLGIGHGFHGQRHQGLAQVKLN